MLKRKKPPEKEMCGADKQRAKKKKKVNRGCGQMHKADRSLLSWWEQPGQDDTGPSSSTATAGKQALSAVTRRYHDLRLETRVVTRTDTTGNLNVTEPGSAPAAWCGHSHS